MVMSDAGRNRAEIIQHYDFDHEAVCPDSPQYPQLDAAGYIDLPLTFVLIKQKIFKVTQIIRHKLLWMKTRVKLFLC